MAISILAQAVVDKSSGGDSSYTHGAFAVPGGTTRLLVQVEYRGFADAAAPALTSVTHNGDAVSFLAGSATTGGFDDITTWWGQLANPDIGTFNVVVTFPSNVRGVKLWLLAISGEKASGSILGQSSFQRKAGAVTDTVGLGVTPAASGDSLLLASLAIAQSTTLTTWTGTGWTAVATDTYTGGGNLTSTSRYLLNAPGGAALTVSAKFGASDTDIGGSLIEILAEPVGTDVSDTFGVTLAMAGSVAGGSSAALTDASFRRLAAWTEVLAIQPDLAGVDRRILAAGPGSAPNLVVDQIASGSVYRWRYRLTDGDVTVDSAVGTQSVAAQHIALVHGGEGGPAMYLNGVQSIGAIAGSDLTGITDIGAGGETIGSHATGTAYTGLIGRYLLADSALSAEQVRLLALSQTDPDAIWGVGVEDDAQVANQSPVVLPMVVEPDGRPQITVRPTIIDPNGTGAVLSSVTLPTHGSVVIADKDLVINLEPGWVGRDSFTVTASDGSKTSTAKITIVQTRPALLVQGDSITLTESSSTTFDPRSNDIGAGELRTISASNGAHGTTAVLADGRISFTAGAVTGDTADSFSYTVADDWGSASATVAVTIRESGTSFVSASNDSVETIVGTAIPIPVLANDTASSDNLPIVVQPGSITTPAPSGTAALQPDGQILYTPVSGFTGDASFQYTVKPASKPLPTSTATVLVRVVSALAGYPKWPMGYTSWTSVPVARIRPVGFGVVGAPGPSGGYTTIAAAYAAAATDDWIVVNDGTWPGNFTFNRDFGGNGIVICGRNVANGRDPLTILTGKYPVSGDGHWFHHLRISYAGTATDDVQSTSSFEGHPFVVTGARNTWTRNWFTIPKGIQLNRGNGTHTNRICYNRWTTTRPQGNSWISFQNGQMAESDNWHHDTIVARNYMRQSTAASYKNSYLIHIGNAHADPGNWWLWRGMKIERNLLIVSTTTGYDKFVYLKFGVQSFSYNTLIGPASFIHRHGSIQYTTPASAKTASTQTCPQWHGNWIEGSSGGYASGVQLNGCGFDIRGNYVKASGGIRLFNGFQRDNAYEAQYQAASDSLLVGNQVVTNGGRPYIIGYVEDLLNYDATQGHKIKNVNIFGHTGAAVTGGVSSLFQDAAQIETGTCSFSTGYGSYPTPPAPVKLDETMVGFEVTGQAGTA